MNHFLKILFGVILASALAGCNVGSVPSGMSEQDAKNAIDKMPPEEKIKFFASSPMSAEEKAKKYAEIEAATGVKASDVLGAGAGAGQPAGR